MWFDFFVNPFNRNTKGLHKRGIYEFFSEDKCLYLKRIGLAPSVVRMANKISSRLVVGLEKLVLLNAYYLALLQKKR